MAAKLYYFLFCDDYQFIVSDDIDLGWDFIKNYNEGKSFILKEPIEYAVRNHSEIDNILSSLSHFEPSLIKDIVHYSDTPHSFHQKNLMVWYMETQSTKLRDYLGYGVWVLFEKKHVNNKDIHGKNILNKNIYFFSKNKALNQYNEHPNLYVMKPLFIPMKLEQMVVLYSHYEWKIVNSNIKL